MPNNSKQPGYEIKDADTRGILIFMALVVAGCLIGYVAVKCVFVTLEKRAQERDRQTMRNDVQPSAAGMPAYFPDPREQPAPKEDLAAFRARENAELSAYGWIDQKAGIVRIPVSRAIDLLSERGLPARTAVDNNAGLGSLQLQQQRPGATSSRAGDTK